MRIPLLATPLAAIAVAASGRCQVVITVAAPPSWAALAAAFATANSYTGSTSATNTVTVRMPSAYIGRTLLQDSVPRLLVDYLRVEVQGAAAGDRVVLDA